MIDTFVEEAIKELPKFISSLLLLFLAWKFG